jgi:crossover junction endodeoxyribonuclease RuvC
MTILKTLGLDVSTRTGCVVLEEQFGPPRLLYEAEWQAPKDVKGEERWSWMAEQLIGALDTHHPHHIVLEGYSFGHLASQVITAVEIGTVLRYFMRQKGYAYDICSPSTLKKFVTGKGNTPKDMIMMHVLKRWGHESLTNNTADAYGLACVGLALKGRMPNLTVPQKEALKAIGKVV